MVINGNPMKLSKNLYSIKYIVYTFDPQSRKRQFTPTSVKRSSVFQVQPRLIHVYSTLENRRAELQRPEASADALAAVTAARDIWAAKWLRAAVSYPTLRALSAAALRAANKGYQNTIPKYPPL
ncbi:hypothetical protein EVAR_32104_1 [Eumeta japonica]|uniref:Uncharacterized protein n=1 Tax=Eumeta variegata TaxID=151549 RepID=A0A4C1V5G1_EUMVA|nr:hypothetical protein EVAR_32104_1 [Eumeta japonica]